MSRNLQNKATLIGQILVEMYARNIAEDIAEARGSSWKVAFFSPGSLYHSHHASSHYFHGNLHVGRFIWEVVEFYESCRSKLLQRGIPPFSPSSAGHSRAWLAAVSRSKADLEDTLSVWRIKLFDGHGYHKKKRKVRR